MITYDPSQPAAATSTPYKTVGSLVRRPRTNLGQGTNQPVLKAQPDGPDVPAAPIGNGISTVPPAPKPVLREIDAGGFQPAAAPPGVERVNNQVTDYATPAQPAAPTAPAGPPPQPFGGIRTQTISPTVSARTAGYNNQVDSLAGALPGAQERAAAAGAGTEYAQGVLAPRAIQGGGAVAFDPVTGGPDLRTTAGAVANTETQAADPYIRLLRTADLKAGPAINPDADPRLTAAQGNLDSSVKKLGSLSRTDYANQLLKSFEEQSAENEFNQLRNAGGKAAALGRLGHSGTAKDIQEIERKTQMDRRGVQAGLARDLTEGEIADQKDIVNLFRGLVGDEQGYGLSNRNELRTERANVQDIASANRAAEQRALESGLAAGQGAAATARRADETEREYRTRLEEENKAGAESAAVRERDYKTGLEATNEAARQRANETALGYGAQTGDNAVADQYKKLGTIANLASVSQGTDQAAESSQVRERARADELAQTAINNAERRTQLEEALRNGDFTRMLALLNAGTAGDPGDAELAAAAGSQAEADGTMGSIAELLKSWALRNGTK